MTQKIFTLLLLSISILLAEAPLEVELEHNTTGNTSLMVTLKVTNTSEKPVDINPANFLYANKDTMARSLFSVLEDGEKIPYIGIIAFTKPSKKSLAPGESYSGSVDLKKHYGVHKGTYDFEIEYKNREQNISASLEFEASVTKKKKRDSRSSRRRSCSNSQMSILRSALQNARFYVYKAKNNLVNSPRNHALYQKWFGTATPDRYQTVYYYFSRIYSGLHQNVTFDCNSPECLSDWGAFVYPNQPYNINICSQYWGNHNKYDDKPSMLIHEMSHFYVVANTLDGYGDGSEDSWGVDKAPGIARVNPNVAIRNAYSYQGYASEVGHSNGNSGGNSAGGTSALYYGFNSYGNTEGWRYGNLNQAYGGPYSGAWFFQANSNDPQLISPNININANVIKRVTIRMANAYTASYYSYLQLFWRSGNNGYSEYRSKIISVTNHGGWTTYTIDMSNAPGWSGNISQIRIDPLTRGDGHWIGIDYIKLH